MPNPSDVSDLLSPGLAISRQKKIETQLGNLVEKLVTRFLEQARKLATRVGLSLTAARISDLWDVEVVDKVREASFLDERSAAYAANRIADSSIPSETFNTVRETLTAAQKQDWSEGATSRALQSALALGTASFVAKNETELSDEQRRAILNGSANADGVTIGGDAKIEEDDNGNKHLLAWAGLVAVGMAWNNRANLDTRMAVTGLDGEATSRRLRAAGVPSKQWVSRRDSDVRETHSQADGQKRVIEDAFDVGGASLQYPGDPTGPPEEIMGCRCVLVGIEQTLDKETRG